MAAKHFLLLMCCMLALVPLASAQTETFTAPNDQAIWAVYITSPVGTSGTITFTQANGDTVSGSWSYTGLVPSTFTAELGSSGSKSFSYVVPLNAVFGIWNGENTTYDRQLKFGFGQARGVWNGVGSTTIDRAVITGYTISADQQVTIQRELIPRSSAVAALSETDDGNLVTLLENYAPLVVSIFTSLFYWLKFLFVDNLIVTVLLYMTGTLAYAVNSSRNIFQVYKTWFKQQRALFEFAAQGFNTVFQIITQVASIIGRTMGAAANIAITVARIILRI